jgi:hypothetical protein
MNLVAMIYIQSFINTGSGIHMFIRGGVTETRRQHGNLISLVLFLRNKEKSLRVNSHACLNTVKLSSERVSASFINFSVMVILFPVTANSHV